MRWVNNTYSGYTYQSHNPAWRNHPNFLLEEPTIQPPQNQPPPPQPQQPSPTKSKCPIDLLCSPNFQNQPQGGYPKNDPMESQLATVQASLQQLLQFQTNQSQNFAQIATIPSIPTKSEFASE